MKYLYKILRLFFCPHKYGVTVSEGTICNADRNNIGKYYDRKCNYCGKIKAFNNIR